MNGDYLDPLTSFNWEPEPFVRFQGQLQRASYRWDDDFVVLAAQSSGFGGAVEHIAVQFRRRP